MSTNVTVTKDRTKDLAKALKALTTREVLIGIPSEKAQRQPDQDDPEPLNNAEIGYLQEHGSPEANIPARPFLAPGVASIGDEAAKRLAAGARRALDGDLPAVDKTLNAVGLIGQNAVREKITDGPFVPLKASTLANRKRRGRIGDRPLIDTGQLRNAVSFVVRSK